MPMMPSLFALTLEAVLNYQRWGKRACTYKQNLNLLRGKLFQPSFITNIKCKP